MPEDLAKMKASSEEEGLGRHDCLEEGKDWRAGLENVLTKQALEVKVEVILVILVMPPLSASSTLPPVILALATCPTTSSVPGGLAFIEGPSDPEVSLVDIP